jgi:hypothetical protein
MMHFLEPAVDGELMAELRDVGLLAPDTMERIDALMGHPETGTLNAFLLAGADVIPEKPWLTWLIRHHGCDRFGRVTWHGGSAAWAQGELPDEGNLPFRECEDRSLLLAVLRPDLLAATARRWPWPLHRAAATLAEIRALHAAWREIRGPGRDPSPPTDAAQARTGSQVCPFG